jgi:hypothetical protein
MAGYQWDRTFLPDSFASSSATGIISARAPSAGAHHHAAGKAQDQRKRLLKVGNNF